MNAPPTPSLPTAATTLNATPLSQNVAALLQAAKAPMDNPLVLVNLLQWAVENHYSAPSQGEMELGAAVRAARDDPEAVYEALADPRLETATSLEQAAAVLVSRMSDLMDDRATTGNPG
jgi:hypothetical protein